MGNKRVLALGIALMLTAIIVGSAFAEEAQKEKEYEYTVSVLYRVSTGRNNDGTKAYDYSKPPMEVKYTLWASSPSEATKVATERCQYEKGNTVSCGGAIATGRSREK